MSVVEEHEAVADVDVVRHIGLVVQLHQHAEDLEEEKERRKDFRDT